MLARLMRTLRFKPHASHRYWILYKTVTNNSAESPSAESNLNILRDDWLEYNSKLLSYLNSLVTSDLKVQLRMVCDRIKSFVPAKSFGRATISNNV